MGRQIKGLLYFYVADSRYTLAVFWGILTGTILLATVITYVTSQVTDIKMVFSIPALLYIFAGIFGFKTAKQAIPFSIKLGATRKNIFISLGIFFLGLAIGKAVLANTLQAVFLLLNKTFGIKGYIFMHPAQLLTDTWLTRVCIDATMMFCILAVMYFVGLVFYRYGMVVGLSIPAAAVILFMFATAKGWVSDYAIHLYDNLSLGFFLEVFLVGIVIYGLTWLMAKKITILSAG